MTGMEVIGTMDPRERNWRDTVVFSTTDKIGKLDYPLINVLLLLYDLKLFKNSLGGIYARGYAKVLRRIKKFQNSSA